MSGYRYTLAFAGYEVTTYGPDDAHARRRADRWLRLFWDRYAAHVAERYPGSMRHAEVEGWHDVPPFAAVWRRTVDDAGIISNDAELIESFPIPEGRHAFSRFVASGEPGPFAMLPRPWFGWAPRDQPARDAFTARVASFLEPAT